MSVPTLPENVSDILAAHDADMDAIVEQLRQVVAKPGDTTFLIVAVGDVYIQYIAGAGSKRLSVEAVSSENLPKELQLGAEAIAVLHALGFSDPDAAIEGANFEMDRDAINDADIESLAVIAIVAIYAAYGCPADAKLEYELSLN